MVAAFLHGQDKIKTSLKEKETSDREPKLKIRDMKKFKLTKGKLNLNMLF